MDASAFSRSFEDLFKVGIAAILGFLILCGLAGYICYRAGLQDGIKGERHRVLVDSCSKRGGSLDEFNLCIDGQHKVIDPADSR